MKQQLLIRILLGLIAVILLAWGIKQYIDSLHNPSTDDAYINAHQVSISAQVSGQVTKVYVSNNQIVKKDEPLFDIDPRPYRYALSQARAELALTKQNLQAEQDAVATDEARVVAARADYHKALIHYRRIMPLVKSNQLPASDSDDAIGALNASKADLTASKKTLLQAEATLGQPGPQNASLQKAKAALDQAKFDLSHTHVRAPASGIIANLSLRAGTSVTPNISLFSLVENKSWWVDANFKETMLKTIKPGQPADIVLATYPDHTFKGVVQSISPGSGNAFALLPAENASGNWVKVTQRFPVKILINKPDPNYPLRIGASSTVTVHTD